MRRLVQILKVVLSLVLYGVLGPFGYVGFVIASLLPTRDEARRARRFQWAIFRGFRLMHDWLRILAVIDYDPRRVVGQLPEGGCLVVANHPMLTDVTVVMAAFRDVVTLIRETTYDRWWLKPLLIAAGQVSSPLSPTGVAPMNEEIRRRFTQGFRVLVFPEGQRSHPDGTLREFSRAPFEAAYAAGVPVVPLVVRGAPAWLKKGQKFFEPLPTTPRVRVETLDPIDPTLFESSRALRDHVRNTLATAALLPPPDVPPALEAA